MNNIYNNYEFILLLKQKNYEIIKNYSEIFKLITLLLFNIKNSWKGEYILSNEQLFDKNKDIQLFYINKINELFDKNSVDDKYVQNAFNLMDYI